MDHSVHLVIVHGDAPQARAAVDHHPKTFFARQFPGAAIDEFSFPELPGPLHQRANVLLEQLLASREKLQETSGKSSKPLPIIFLAHGLGGFVAKQALISATEEQRYSSIALNTRSTLFFGVPHTASPTFSWEKACLRLLLSSVVLLDSLSVINRFVRDVKGVSESFRTIPCSISIANFFEAESKHPVASEASLAGRREDIAIDCRVEELWKFEEGKPLAVQACKRITSAANAQQLALRDLLHALSQLDPQTHRLTPSFSDSTVIESHLGDLPIGNEAFISWRAPGSGRVLALSGFPGSGTTALSSRILGLLMEQQQSSGDVILSFKFDENNIRANSHFSLWLSFCRQLLTLRPDLHQKVSAASSFLLRSDALTADSLWSLVRSMLMRILSEKNKVYCVVDSIDGCRISRPGMVQRLEELAVMGDGFFKLLLSGPDVVPASASGDSGKYLLVEIDAGSDEMVICKQQLMERGVRALGGRWTEWAELQSLAVAELGNRPKDISYLLIRLNLLLLDWTTRRKTTREIKQRIRNQPNTLSDCYLQILEAITHHDQRWVFASLWWIVHAVRPLRPTELAAGVALTEVEELPPQDSEDISKGVWRFEDIVRNDIVGQLGDSMEPLIRIEDNRVHLIHSTFRDFLLKHLTQLTITRKARSENEDVTGTPEAQEDGHLQVFLYCTEYLKDAKHRLTCINDNKLGLLNYALVHWPEHFLQAISAPLAKEKLLSFLVDNETIAFWTSRYHELRPVIRTCGYTLDTPLKIACYFGLASILDDCLKLAEASDNVEAQKRESLDLASHAGHSDIVQKLLEMGTTSRNAPGIAASAGFKAILASLIMAQADAIDGLDDYGYAPLHRAACAGNQEIVSMLLEKGAEPDISTSLPIQVMDGRTGDEGSTSPESVSESSSDSGTTSSTDATAQMSQDIRDETSLHMAVLTGQKEIVRILLSHGATASQESSVGYDALKYAAMGGFLDLVDLFLKDGADAHKPAPLTGDTALHLAAAQGHLEISKRLLKSNSNAGVLIHSANKSGFSPLHLAAKAGHLETLRFFFSIQDGKGETESVASTEEDRISTTGSRKGGLAPRISRRLTGDEQPRQRVQTSTLESSEPSEPPTTHQKTKSPLELAAENGHVDVVKALLKRKADDKKEQVALALVLASAHGHVNVVSELVQVRRREIAMDPKGNTALHLAVKNGHGRTVAVLLHRLRSLDVDAKNGRGETALHLASRAGYKEIAELLLRSKAQPDVGNGGGHTALHLAASRGWTKTIDLLLRYRADIMATDSSGRTALHLAAVRRKLDACKMLLQQSPDITWCVDEDGKTALDLVVECGRLDLLEEFIQMVNLEKKPSADSDLLHRPGMPLHVAQDEHVMRRLLQLGWPCDARLGNRKTPLHCATSAGFAAGVRLLHEHGCDMNAVDDQGFTPLHLAPSAELVELLLGLGAKNDEKNSIGRTPMFMAVWYGALDRLKALLSSEPKPDINMIDNLGWGLVHGAYDNAEITQFLLDSGAPYNILDEDGLSPLALAIRRYYIGTAKVLLNGGADPNLASSLSCSPMWAVSEVEIPAEEKIEMMMALADKKAHLLEEDSAGVTAVHLAARTGRTDLVEYFVKKVQDTYGDGEGGDGDTKRLNQVLESVFLDCLVRPSLSMADFFLEHGLVSLDRVTSPEFLTLQEVCHKGNAVAVQWLLKHGAPVNAVGGDFGTALCAAIESSTDDAKEKVLLLLDNDPRADVDLSGKDEPTPLQRAAARGNDEILALLLARGANVTLTRGDWDAPLNLAIESEEVSLDRIVEMLNKGADKERKSKTGILPAHVAAQKGRVEVLRALQTSGANLCALATDGQSPLMHGLIHGNIAVVRFLLQECPPPVDERNVYGQTPVIAATLQDDHQVLELLLEKDFGLPSVVNSRDSQGRTALTYAVIQGSLGIVRMLLKKGADPRIEDCRSNSALYWAARLPSGGLDVLSEICEAIKSRQQGVDLGHLWSAAAHGAAASTNTEVLDLLLNTDNDDLDLLHPDASGWTPLYTAQQYKSEDMERLVTDALGFTPVAPDGFRIPTAWHPRDRDASISFDPERDRTLGMSDGIRFRPRAVPVRVPYGSTTDQYGIARADHPMVPLINKRIYYFEVKITKFCGQGTVGIGFCEDTASVMSMLGWERGAWALHSDDGNLYDPRTWVRRKLVDPFGQEGVTIGCGVNFDKGVAFYTKDGQVLGQAFPDISGKLYPAVGLLTSVEGSVGDLEIEAVFPGPDGRNANFAFTGDFEGEDMMRHAESNESERDSETSSQEEEASGDSDE